MRAKVIRAFNDGRPVARWQLGTLVPVEGEIRLQEGRDDHLRRNLRTAHLFDFTRPEGADVVPPLLDAAVIFIKDNLMSISGFERDELRTYAQTWLIEFDRETNT